jgi:hypothetical protein
LKAELEETQSRRCHGTRERQTAMDEVRVP